VGQGSVRPFDDDLDAYRKLVLGGPEAVAATKETPKAAQEPRRDAAERRALLGPLRKKIEAADQRMTKLADLLRRVDTALADPNTFLRDPDRAAQLSIQRATLEKNVMVAEEEWLALSSEYEQVAAG
jgi:ATP-binding cassette subfamily F protein 3